MANKATDSGQAQDTADEPTHNIDPRLSDRDVIYALRTVHQNQTQLVMIADQKANMLMGLVAIVLTLLYSNSGLNNSLDASLSVPFTMFMIVEIFAVLFALAVILPRNVHGNRTATMQSGTNPLFFGSFRNVPEDVYVEYLLKNLRNDHEARLILIRDIYNTGKILGRKYRLLRLSYILAVGGVLLLCSLSLLSL